MVSVFDEDGTSSIWNSLQSNQEMHLEVLVYMCLLTAGFICSYVENENEDTYLRDYNSIIK